MIKSKLNRKQPFATIIGHDNPLVVTMQGRGYYDRNDDLVAEEPEPEKAPEKAPEPKAEKSSVKAKKDAVKRAASILGDLGEPDATEPQQAAVKENMAAEHAESKAE